MSKKVDYWLELSDYDLQTAAVMLNGGRFLYVGFMAHQAIEKILKAYFVKNSNNTTPPHSHRLSLLAKKASLYSLFSESQKNFIDILEPMNIESRYPSNKDRLLKSLTEERCTQILQETEELHLWIRQKLLQS